MATALMPSSLQAQITRSAISPRFAIKIFLNMKLRLAMDGFDDAQQLSLTHSIADLDEGGRARRWSFIERADNGRLHDEKAGVRFDPGGGRLRRSACASTITTGWGRCRGWSRCRRSEHGNRRHRRQRGSDDHRSGLRSRSPLNVELHVTALELELGDVLLHQKLDQFPDFFLIHRIPSGRTLGQAPRVQSVLWLLG